MLNEMSLRPEKREHPTEKSLKYISNNELTLLEKEVNSNSSNLNLPRTNKIKPIIEKSSGSDKNLNEFHVCFSYNTYRKYYISLANKEKPEVKTKLVIWFNTLFKILHFSNKSITNLE